MARRFPTRLLCLLAILASWAPAEAQYFGRNKVRYRAFDFQIIRTPHFDVYYYPEEREAAVDAARMVERSYARLSRLLQHEFRERKPLIVYASHTDFQQTNALPSFIDESTGGVTEALKSRMILPFTGSYADFDHVLTHELVHGFQFDVIFRRGIMTEAAPMGVRLPLWFMEGMAEYLSVGEIDPHTQSWLRDAVLGGYLRTIDEMNYRDDYLSYRFGQSLWSYVGNRWGDEVIGILLQKAPRVGLERAFASTLGLTLEELSQAWTAAVREQYLPQVAEHQRPQGFAKRITAHDRLYDPWYLSPALSPDGQDLVYLSQEDGFFFDLWLADAVTGEKRRRLVEAARDADFESLRYMSSGASFSPDGRWLAFAAQTGGRDALYLYDVERQRVDRKLTFDLNGIASPTWSPDGRNIAFSGLDGGLSDLYVTDLDGHLRRLTDDRYADLMPAWSPDGRYIAFSTDRGAGTDFDRLAYGNLRVALFDLESGAIRTLPEQEQGKNHNPVWSPDGGKLIWVGDRTGTNNLYLYDLEAQTLERITDVLSGIIAITPLSPALSWSASGRLAFVYFENAGYNIYTVEDPLALPRVPVSAPVLANGDRTEPAEVRAQDPPQAPGTPGTAVDPRREPSFAGSFYRRSRGGFRASDLLEREPAREKDAGPVSVMALLDSAALALPDTLAFEYEDYNVRFTPDLVGRPTIGAQVGGHYGNGLYGGSYVSLSDMLGNHNLVGALALNGSLSDATFLTGYSFLKTRLNWSASLSQVPLYRYLGTGYVPIDIDGESREALADVFLRDLVRSAQVSASYPFSPYRRIELGASAVHYSTDVLYLGIDRQSGEALDEDRQLDALSYVQPMAALVFDNSLFGWTGPIYGRRYRVQISHTLGGLGFTEGLLDFRNYWNIARKVVFAGRVIGLVRTGPDSERFPLYWGGAYFLRGYGGGSFDLDGEECRSSRGTSSMSRCPARDQLIGSSAAFVNLEVRVPVVTELQIGFLGTFPPIDAVAFFDGGLAWDQRVCNGDGLDRYSRCQAGQSVHVVWQREPGQDPYLYRQPLFSYGVGLRINVFYTVLRLDYALPLSRPDRGGRFSVSFGPSF